MVRVCLQLAFALALTLSTVGCGGAGLARAAARAAKSSKPLSNAAKAASRNKSMRTMGGVVGIDHTVGNARFTRSLGNVGEDSLGRKLGDVTSDVVGAVGDVADVADVTDVATPTPMTT